MKLRSRKRVGSNGNGRIGNTASSSTSHQDGNQATKRRWLLSETVLEHVADYKYVAGTSTPLDHLMNHYWNWAVQWLPLWLAPNLVTLLGLLCMILSAGVVIWTTPTLTGPMPFWVAALCLVSLFAYQTLDAIDGKQARRTGSSSPLGQLFDHGCDALNTVFICTVLAGAWRLGDHPWLMLNTLFNIFFAFFMGQWEEYHTGAMMTNNGYVGVTEGQVVQMGILLFTGCLGGEAWDMPIKKIVGAHHLGSDLTVKAVCMTGGTILTLWVSISSLFRVLMGKARKLPADEVGEKRLAGGAAFWHLLPMIISFILGGLWTIGHGHHVFVECPVGVIMGLGMSMTYLSTRMIVCHMAKQPFGDAEMVIPVFLQLLIVINTYWQQSLHLPRVYYFPLSDGLALWSYVSIMTAIYFCYVLGVIHDICIYLNIYCLRIHPRNKDASH